jgi:Cys-tRNA synthase (O-phospho-L-seryl-tRNA:Cys-tRNA synthase)
VEFIIPVFLNCSTCFGRHTAYHQELKTVIAASGFTYGFGCRLPLRWLSHRSVQQPKTYEKPEAAITVFELLMMGCVSPETCRAIKKHWNNKFYYTVSSSWFFL